VKVFLAYLAVVLLWSTTPLAIKWSTEGSGHLFGVTARMTMGLGVISLYFLLTRKKLPLHSKALRAYLAGSVQIFGSMLLTYWSSQFIPSGWISVIFGLVPILTAPLAAIWLKERSLTPCRLIASCIGFGGVFLMFKTALTVSTEAVLGILGIVFAAFLQAISSVWTKRIDAGLTPGEMVFGALMISVPAYISVWGMFDPHFPSNLPISSVGSILYLGAIATTIGFALYYYLLAHLPATRVALITLIVPPLSLYVGYIWNSESIHEHVRLGTLLIMSALLLYQYGDRVITRVIRRKLQNSLDRAI
jgi:drug/metabolite transporter (DMT)-like permease